MKITLGLCAILFVLMARSYAFSPAWDKDLEKLAPLKTQIVPPESQGTYNFEGIVKLSNCSGAIVKFEGQPLEEQALVLTNGHCVSRWFIRPGEIILDQKDRRRMRVFDSSKRLHRVRANRLLYGTMTGTDAALFRLDETYEDLERKGIRGFLLSDIRPYVGTDIEVVSGYWERGYTCQIEEFVHELREDDWVFQDSIRYSRPGCETIGGTSGSPIIEKGTRQVIGVNNSANESGRQCTMNNPCEVDENNNVSVIKGASYGQQTYTFYTCLTADWKIDVNQVGCELQRIVNEEGRASL